MKCHIAAGLKRFQLLAKSAEDIRSPTNDLFMGHGTKGKTSLGYKIKIGSKRLGFVLFFIIFIFIF